MKSSQNPNGVAGEVVDADPDEPQAPDSPYLERFGINAGWVEEVHDQFRVDARSVDESWSAEFGGVVEARAVRDEIRRQVPQAIAQNPPVPAAPAIMKSEPPPPPNGQVTNGHDVNPQGTPAAAPVGGAVVDDAMMLHIADKHARVLRLIHAYRARGHRVAHSDPLGGQSTYFPELDPAHYGFGNENLEEPFVAGDLPGGSVQTLRQILTRLGQTYCGPIGVEFTHVQDPGRKAWLRELMEESQNHPNLEDPERRKILEKLAGAELFCNFLATKFLGQKRFSLEGGESLIPLLDHIVESAPSYGIREVVLGMAHRGRLNVLANILGKSYESIFSEFEDSPDVDAPFGSGDVKYHKGFSSDRRVATGERVHLTLTSNPSHLEAVDPVVEGRTKAKQVRAGDVDGETIVPVIVHGDAAFAGQGMVAETLNLSQLAGYCTGGTIHIIVNNQIGYTTTPAEARSTLYCSDVAKMIQVPIFHVNGDHPEAVIHVTKLAMAYRQRFGDDVVIDMVCYRRHGHNEGDEPAFTQPRLYQKIRDKKSVKTLYMEKLVAGARISQEEADQIDERQQAALKEALEIIHSKSPEPDEPYEPRGPWTGYTRVRPEQELDTAIPLDRLRQIADGISRVPSYFSVHKKLQSILDSRAKAVSEDSGIDWGLGEALAYGSLVLEGIPVRLSGQDSSRGTFAHRHAVLVDQQSGEEYAPLDHISDTQARFEVYDSLLSEAAVLGFEYGYSLADPSSLVLWEAQFGDFVNGAQVIIDQFITSAHVKWGRMSGLVMLLPHGYEGQGPEHSSARVERFLQTCAEDSLQVVNCTNSAQFFHVLRRQMKRTYRAPLIVFTPKSLLRHPKAASRVDDFTNGRFQEVIDDPIASARASEVKRVIICVGKVYYDLVEERAKRFAGKEHEVAIIRVEQLYPWPEKLLTEFMGQYRSAQRRIWCQEEPRNMGGWTFVRDRLEAIIGDQHRLEYAGRDESASPAAGSPRIHRAQLQAFLDDALGD
ncbi:MAG: 2-oxoglutarate dehydrogenase E1 component [Myxococcales bacterium]|nr:2-oxoglutarate dehydrogenase E1 component [Myxococcales bacterium]HIK83756.1 2-oxoglutarate dehydrogenase E1 component [Myxococcales bacterium]